MFLPKHGLEFHRFVSRVVNVYKILEAGDHLASLAAGFQPAFFNLFNLFRPVLSA